VAHVDAGAVTARLRRIPWSALLTIGVLVWAAPRALPHLGALFGARARESARPRFTVVTLAGDTLGPSQWKGQVVLVNLWATWCVPCRVEMPLVERSWRQHRAAGLRVLGASIDRGDPNVVREYVLQRGVSYPIAIIDRETLAALGGVQGVPTSILIGRDGLVRHRVVGPIGPLTLEPAIRRALAEPPPQSP
jgi:thiol-disulfide isomerase/thioredoxin